MKFNLREDETSEYFFFYQKYLEEVQRLNKKVTDELNEVMQESKYDKLQNRISEIIDAYMETIVGNIENGLFSNWIESNGSLRSCLRTYKAGEAADEVCAQIEQNMGDLMQNVLKIEKAEIIITERPIVSEDGLDRLEDACRNAQTEIQNIKAEYISQVDTRSGENEIFDTLRPLYEGIASNLEAFFEASLNSFTELHEFINEISAQLHNIAEEQSVGNFSNNGITKEMARGLAASASALGSATASTFIEKFKEITSMLYHLICDVVSSEKKKIPYDFFSKIMSIYHKFYSDYGEILKDKFDNPEEFVKREYSAVTKERNNDQFFDGTNLMHEAYVLFTPIIEGHINPENSKKCSKFGKWASAEILKLLEEEHIIEEDNQTDQEEDINFEGEKFSDENIKLFVVVVERIVNQVGVDELNSSVEKHYITLKNSRKAYSRKAEKGTASTHNIAENTYGRYTVTRKSIQAMAPVCNEINSIFEPIDKFYKEKFESLGKGFEKANTIIHAISSLCGLWGLENGDLSKMFSAEESDSSILEKVKLGGMALASCTNAGMIINGGVCMLKIMDYLMPRFKKSKILVKLSEKVWNLTRQDIQIPYIQKMMDQYMMEHYELKYGMNKSQSPYFEYYHSVATSLEDNHQRRAFENSIFAAETFLTPQHYIVKESNPQKYREICCGIFLNLVRSGMCSEQDIKSGTSNDIVDKLYNVYKSRENIKPRVDINPDRRAIG